MAALRKTAYSFGDTLRRLLTAWLVTVTVQYLCLPAHARTLAALTGLQQLSPVWTLVGTSIIFVLLWTLSRFWDTAPWERWLLPGSFFVLSLAGLLASFSFGLLGACLLILAILAVYAKKGRNRCQAPPPSRKTGRLALAVTAGLAVAFFLFVSLWTVCRVRSFSVPTYDMGIFSQMFHNMKASGLPITTVERDGPLSHFAVHVSPIYYLLLPFYCLVPRPETLQVLQAAVMVSAVFPMWLIGKHHGLSPWLRCGLCAVLLLYPAFAGGAGYDIHENCFLTPLCLWLLYGIDRQNLSLTAVAALLTLSVKEDAAVYVAVVALFLILRTLVRFQKGAWVQLLTGGALLLVSLVWFFCVTGYLAGDGDGVMTDRYSNLIYDGSGSLARVVLGVLMHPMKALQECVDPEKLPFIAVTLLPLLGLPLWTRRYERYLLLIPYVLVNLMSDYTYQHNIYFQYTFGSLACLMYLTAVNLSELKLPRLLTVWLAAVVCAGCFCGTVVPKAAGYMDRCLRHGAYYRQVRDTLEQIPDDAGVTATTFYTTVLSGRETLYDVRYSSRQHLLETEYVVLSLTATDDYKKYGSLASLEQLLLREGYREADRLDGVLVIYHR